MARLKKEQYDYRRESAAQRMIDNSEIITLTKEQHDTIAELCKMRHEIHCNQSSFINGESCSYSEYHNYLENLNYNLTKQNLEKIEGLQEFYTSIDDYYEDYINEGKWETVDDCETQAYEEVGELNTKIEVYLQNIDKVYGTSYCPSGQLRK